MNNEKVKEIKKDIEICMKSLTCENCSHHSYRSGECCRNLTNDILIYINELESENEKLKQHKRELQGGQHDLCVLNKEQTLRIAELENIGLNEEITVGEYLQEMQRLKDRVAELEKENEDYYERCVILRRENEQLKTLVSSLENQIYELKDRIADLEGEITKLDAINSKLEMDIELLNKQNIDLEIDRDYYQEQFNEQEDFYVKWNKQQLEQFAEMLKEKLEEYRLENEYFIKDEPNGNLWQLNASVFCIEVTQDGGLVDETLKEFIEK